MVVSYTASITAGSCSRARRASCDTTELAPSAPQGRNLFSIDIATCAAIAEHIGPAGEDTVLHTSCGILTSLESLWRPFNTHAKDIETRTFAGTSVDRSRSYWRTCGDEDGQGAMPSIYLWFYRRQLDGQRWRKAEDGARRFRCSHARAQDQRTRRYIYLRSDGDASHPSDHDIIPLGQTMTGSEANPTSPDIEMNGSTAQPRCQICQPGAIARPFSVNAAEALRPRRCSPTQRPRRPPKHWRRVSTAPPCGQSFARRMGGAWPGAWRVRGKRELSLFLNSR